jgi:hypothetical protein
MYENGKITPVGTILRMKGRGMKNDAGGEFTYDIL